MKRRRPPSLLARLRARVVDAWRRRRRPAPRVRTLPSDPWTRSRTWAPLPDDELARLPRLPRGPEDDWLTPKKERF